jgi:4,5-dihydroxyphthalate decarboxylase
LTGGDYAHVRAMSRVRDGIDIRYTPRPLKEVFERMIAERAFESCEFSLSNYLMLRAAGADWLTAIPVFPFRTFRHSALYVRRDSPFETPADLVGKRVAVADYSMTAAVWVRGTLNDRHGVHWTSIRWVSGRNQRFAQDYGVDLSHIDEPLEEALINGNADAFLGPFTADEKKPLEQRVLRPLFRDLHQAERTYFAETGIFPIGHTVVIRNDVLERLPSLPKILFDAFADAKVQARRDHPEATLTPGNPELWRKLQRSFDGDALSYGLTKRNSEVIETLARYLLEQGLISQIPPLLTLFAANSADWRG